MALRQCVCVRCDMPFEAGRKDAKYCPDCKVMRQKERWHTWKAKPGSKDKIREQQREYRARTNYEKEWRVRDIYGIALAEYTERIGDGACEICDRVDQPCLDHCHVTGRIRGVLCRKCNRAIGQLGDTADLVRKALAYLEKP